MNLSEIGHGSGQKHHITGLDRGPPFGDACHILAMLCRSRDITHVSITHVVHVVKCKITVWFSLGLGKDGGLVYYNENITCTTT